MASAPPISFLYNVVILPVAAPAGSAEPHFQLSATRFDRDARYTSLAWSQPQLAQAFARAGCTSSQLHQLLRGNRMAAPGPTAATRDARRLFFTRQQLLAMGLTLPSGDPTEPRRADDPDYPTTSPGHA